jgi:hypothetical protein
MSCQIKTFASLIDVDSVKKCLFSPVNRAGNEIILLKWM